jgi:hypothetical protein
VKVFFISFITLLFICGCESGREVKEPEQTIVVEPPNEETEFPPNIDDVPEGLLDSIDSIVDNIDISNRLYTRRDTIKNESYQSMVFEMKIDKKQNRLVKGILKRKEPRYDLNVSSYFSGGKLIKIEALLLKNNDRSFVYYKDDEPVYFSGNIMRRTAKAMRSEAYSLLMHADNL